MNKIGGKTAETGGFNKEWKELVKAGGQAFGIDISDVQADLFVRHAEQLAAWNRKVNLTSIENPADMAVTHFIDSLAVLPYMNKGGRVLDVGAGGGFPSVPLKVAVPSLELVMVDASRKKVSFLKELIRRLALQKASALHCRVEDIRNTPGFGGGFDMVISRAFASLDRFVMLSVPLLSTGGKIIAMKGRHGLKEAGEICHAGIDISCVSYTLPFSGAARVIVEVVPRPL